MSSTFATSSNEHLDFFCPLIHLPLGFEKESMESSQETKEICDSIVSALKTSGFLLIKSPLVPVDLQTKVLEYTKQFLLHPQDEKEKQLIIEHPTDPKIYCMFENNNSSNDIPSTGILKEYYDALELLKIALLRCIAIGLDLESCNYFTNLHTEKNNSLRLLCYKGITDTTKAAVTGNRCKEHSDYGTITILLTDTASGLEAYYDGNNNNNEKKEDTNSGNGKWLPVPNIEGALVINIGTLLSEWTDNILLATLHRVAGPNSQNSYTSKEVLLEDIAKPRISIAFFADPNKDINIRNHKLKNNANTNTNDDSETTMMNNVEDYINYRSGTDNNRDGVAFTEGEQKKNKGKMIVKDWVDM